jgi:alpha-L-fucosidase 2
VSRKGSEHISDFDHNGSGSVALQKTLLNNAGGKIYLLPAWPKAWDGGFRVHASGGTIITGTVKDGVCENPALA